MKLVVHELKSDGLFQIVRRNRRTIVEAVRPHLYRHGFPAGSLKIQILTEADSLVAESEEVEISSIGSEDYFHGNVRFYISAYLDKNTNYKIKLISSGYTYNDSAFIGWCVGFDLRRYPETYNIDNLLQKPLDLEIWSRSER